MLDLRSDEMVARYERAKESQVIALRAAGGEDNLGGSAVEEVGDRLAGVIDSRTGVLALLMDGAGIPEALDIKRPHRLEDLRKQRRGGIRVHVDPAHTPKFTPTDTARPWSSINRHSNWLALDLFLWLHVWSYEEGDRMPDEAGLYTDIYGRTWNGSFSFSPEEISKVPTKTNGVYQLLSLQRDSWIVAYVGIGEIRTRLRNHYAGRGNWALGRLERPYEMEFVYIVCDRLMATTIESHMVTYAKPPFNTRPEYLNLMQSISIH